MFSYLCGVESGRSLFPSVQIEVPVYLVRNLLRAPFPDTLVFPQIVPAAPSLWSSSYV